MNRRTIAFRLLRVALPLLLFAPAQLRAGDAELSQLWQLYTRGDFFSLREQLPPPSAQDSPQMNFLHAAMLSALHREDQSSAILRQMLVGGALDAAFEMQVRSRLMLNERAMFRYANAMAAIAPLLSRGVADRALLNRARFLRAIADVPPQTTTFASAPSTLPIDRHGRFAARIGRSVMNVLLDTAANVSVLSRAQALQAGLSIRSAYYEIGVTNGTKAQADVATGSVMLGGVRIEHVIFLVLPQTPAGMPVLLGLPVLSGLGTVRFARGAIAVAGDVDRSAPHADLVLDDSDVLLRVRTAGRPALCRLDTGADATVLYAPFTRRDGVFPHGASHVERMGSMAGDRLVRTRDLSDVKFAIGGRVSEPAHTRVLAGDANPNLDCNLGRDVLDGFKPYTIDFRAMRIYVR